MSCYENTLSPCELADISGLVGSGLPDTCTIRTIAWTTRNGYGGTTPTDTSTTTVPCLVTAMPSSRAGDNAPGQQVRAYAFVVPLGTVVAEKDRVDWGGRTLQVTSVSTPQSNQVQVGFTASAVSR